MKRDYRIESHGWKWTLFGGLAMIVVVFLLALVKGAL